MAESTTFEYWSAVSKARRTPAQNVTTCTKTPQMQLYKRGNYIWRRTFGPFEICSAAGFPTDAMLIIHWGEKTFDVGENGITAC